MLCCPFAFRKDAPFMGKNARKILKFVAERPKVSNFGLCKSERVYGANE